MKNQAPEGNDFSSNPVRKQAERPGVEPLRSASSGVMERNLREKAYLIGFLLVAGILFYMGRDLIRGSLVVSWGLAFGGATIVSILLLVVNRFRVELVDSRRELARKEAELSFALKVQQELFPRHLPVAAGLEFSAVCIPASGISGDYYDVLHLKNGRLIFAIADISGKGISAAILMSNIQAFLRVVASMGSPPGEVCQRLNAHLHQVTDASRFATIFYGEWHPTERLLRYVNAGHNPPFLIGRDGFQTLNRGGVPLGIFPSYEYETGEVSLSSGDLLALFSDGITEAGARDGREFGEERLRSLLNSRNGQPLVEIESRILQAVRAWSGEEVEDDMTLMLIRVVDEEHAGS